MAVLLSPPVLDLRGKIITTYLVYQIVEEFERIEVGHSVEVTTDAFPPIEADLRAWCDVVGHELVSFEHLENEYRFVIAKGESRPSGSKLAMTISSDRLEELLSPLGFALAAALEGIHVSLYFLGPAVRVLRRGFQPKLGGWGRPFTRMAARQMTDDGHIPAQEKLAQILQLGGDIYLCGPSMARFKVDPSEVVFEDARPVEYLTFMGIMEDANIQMFT